MEVVEVEVGTIPGVDPNAFFSGLGSGNALTSLFGTGGTSDVMGLINAFSSSQQALTNLISTDLLGALGLDTSIQDEIRNSAQQLLGGWAMEIRSQLLRGAAIIIVRQTTAR